MTRVIVIGCGIVGATIAYELSRVAGLEVIVLDPHPPGQGSTGAALGVLMAVVSQKLKGRLVKLRLSSLQRYETLIPELEDCLGQRLPVNRNGILKLAYTDTDPERWQTLIATREKQGWPLEYWTRSQLQDRYPQINADPTYGALYSPQDRQVHPQVLTQALITAAQQQGANLETGTCAIAIAPAPHVPNRGASVITSQGEIATDWVILCAGTATTPLLQGLHYPLEIHPVLGQAIKIYLPDAPVWDAEPVITGNDIHIVPLGQQQYWVGATVEFGEGECPAEPDPEGLSAVLRQATEFYPALAEGEVVGTWSGLRPRPFGRPAPVIEALPEMPNVLLATGHYRNGVLLAPITALQVKDHIQQVRSVG